MRLHPLTTTFQLIMHPHPVMNKRQQTYFHSLKNYYVLTFGRFSLNTNRGRRSVSPLIQTWLIESEVLPCLSYLVMIVRVGERDGLSAANSAYYYRRPIATVSHFLSSQPGEYIRVSYFLVTIYIYIYIYIYTYIYNVPGDQSSISGQFIPKTQKMVLDSTFLNIQHNKVRFKGRD